MEWVKLSTSYDHDAAVLRAGEAAEVMFTRALAYCGREETGGFIADGMPERLCPKGAPARIDALVRELLWVRDDHRRGWWIRSWEAWQSELDALAARRKADRDRKRKERERKAQEAKLSRDGSRDSHVTKPVTSRGLSEVRPDLSPARDREQREETKRTTTGPYAANGRNARAPDDQPPNSDPPGIAERVLGRWLATLPGGTTSPTVVAAIGGHIAANARGGLPESTLDEALRLWQARQSTDRGIGPAVLPSIIHQVHTGQPLSNGQSSAGVPGTNVLPFRSPNVAVDQRPSTTDARVAAALALGAEFAAEEARLDAG